MPTATTQRTIEQILAMPPGTVTYDDYARLPEGAAYQLIQGELIMAPAPLPTHQDTVGNIFVALTNFAHSRKIGRVFVAPIDVYLGPGDTLQPDVIFISRERFAIIGEKKVEAAPDLVVEVLSPGTAYYDLKKKKRLYEQAGVREYWVVDRLDKSVEVFVLEKHAFTLLQRIEGEGCVVSHILPGLNLDLSDVFTSWND